MQVEKEKGHLNKVHYLITETMTYFRAREYERREDPTFSMVDSILLGPDGMSWSFSKVLDICTQHPPQLLEVLNNSLLNFSVNHFHNAPCSRRYQVTTKFQRIYEIEEYVLGVSRAHLELDSALESLFGLDKFQWLTFDAQFHIHILLYDSLVGERLTRAIQPIAAAAQTSEMCFAIYPAKNPISLHQFLLNNAESMYADGTLNYFLYSTTFQILHGLLVILKLFPSFRHNDLLIDNVLLYQANTFDHATHNLQSFKLPSGFGFFVSRLQYVACIANFRHSSIDGVVDNPSSNTGIYPGSKPPAETYSDIEFFCQSLLKDSPKCIFNTPFAAELQRIFIQKQLAPPTKSFIASGRQTPNQFAERQFKEMFSSVFPNESDAQMRTLSQAPRANQFLTVFGRRILNAGKDIIITKHLYELPTRNLINFQSEWAWLFGSPIASVLMANLECYGALKHMHEVPGQPFTFVMRKATWETCGETVLWSFRQFSPSMNLDERLFDTIHVPVIMTQVLFEILEQVVDFLEGITPSFLSHLCILILSYKGYFPVQLCEQVLLRTIGCMGDDALLFWVTQYRWLQTAMRASGYPLLNVE